MQRHGSIGVAEIMAEVTKVLYIVVVDDEDKGEKGEDGKDSFRYTRPVLQSTLQLMGCKARHAFKISKRVFEMMRSQCPSDDLDRVEMINADALRARCIGACSSKAQIQQDLIIEKDDRKTRLPFELYKRRTTVVIRREAFLDVVCDALAEYKYLASSQRPDLVLACRIRERKESVTVLLCGTSGCGKSTLSSLLGSRLGITTVISTDSIRHMMRSFVDEKQNPLLWASTYQAGECLDPFAVAEAKAKRNSKKMAGILRPFSKDQSEGSPCGKSDMQQSKAGSGSNELISPKQMAIEGFKAQSEMVIDSLDRLINAWEERKESVIVEGVHLSLNFVMGLMKKHPSIIPFMIYISNEEKHLERFAVRAKYMTLDPAKNRYVKYIQNIRTIQEYLCHRASKHLVPKVNNTNVDKSVAAIHATVFSCLRRRETGEHLYDPATNTVSVVYEEYMNQCAANSLSSKGMLQLIQRKGSSRHLMALLNTDGSVAKAWPVDSIDNKGNPILGDVADNGVGTPLYEPLQISKVEHVNLQFGHFGVSAWPTDTGGTSHASSFDESRADWTATETGSKYYSSCCSSPRMSDGPAKELKGEQSASCSDEEVDPPGADSDEDLSDIGDKITHEEMEGSVDAESTKSNEEYIDLAIQDVQENGCRSDVEDFKHKLLPTAGDPPNPRNHKKGDKNTYNVDLFVRTKSALLSEPNCLYSSLLLENNDQKKLQRVGSVRMRKHSLSIPPVG
ncbi:hypothetical protein Nepgr_000609 [Nepenthes gracilis]|uniref:Uncharacterized protein n=1 Tax=Nepenthes gracilis TaxID=150966 RepID=A0AAD3P1Y2_NEPGR|nr:hypothetical protein Nepgr_000609 [Nepenthes gracilis]